MFAAPTSAVDSTYNGGQGVRVGTNGESFASILQPDGALVMVGDDSPGSSGAAKSLIARVLPSGLLDSSFASGGTFKTNVSASYDDQLDAVALQPDGSIVAGGFQATSPFNGNPYGTVLRVSGSGVLDSGGFGTGGVFSFGFRSTVAGIAIQSDGAILVAGEDWDDGAAFIARLTASGTLDPTYGSGGIFEFSAFSTESWINAITLQPDGMALVVGSGNAGGNDSGFVARVTTGGTLDPTFGVAGIRTISVGSGNTELVKLALLPDGALLYEGTDAVSGVTSMVVGRLLAAGTVDNSFGSSGSTSIDIGGVQEDLGALSALVSGAIIVGGIDQSSVYAKPVLARLSSSGVLDPEFGTAGTRTYDFTACSGSEQIHGVQAGADGALYVDGSCSNLGELESFRLRGVPVNDYATASDDWSTGANMFGVCLRAVTNGASTDASTWSASATCPLTTGAYWNALPPSPAKIAFSAVSGTLTAEADLRFGFRTSSNQPPGNYVAPLTFDVVAPNV